MPRESELELHPQAETLGQADTVDVEALKKACNTQLRQQNLEVNAFVLKGGRAILKSGTREEILAGCKLRCPLQGTV